MEPGLMELESKFRKERVVSVWPKPSVMLNPVIPFHLLNTFSERGSPAVEQCTREERS